MVGEYFTVFGIGGTPHWQISGGVYKGADSVLAGLKVK